LPVTATQDDRPQGFDIGWVTVLTAAQVVVGAGSFLLLANLLGPKDFGLFSVGVAGGSFLPLVAGLGTEHSLLMFGSRRPQDLPRIMGGTLLVWATLGSILLGLIWLSGALLSPATGAWFVLPVLLSAGLLAGVTSPLLTNYFRILGRTTGPWAILLIGKVLFLAFLISMADGGLSLGVASLAFLLSHLAVLVMMSVWGAASIAVDWSFQEAWSLRGWSVRYWIAQLADMAFLRTDVLLIGAILGPTSVGIYSAGYRIVNLANVVPSAFHVVLMPGFHRAGDSLPDLLSQWRMATDRLTGLSALSLVYFLSTGGAIASVFFGPEYGGSGTIISVLGVYVALNMLAYPLAMVADGRGRVQSRLRARLVGWIVLGLSMLAGVYLFGLSGVAWSVVVGSWAYTHMLAKAAWDDPLVFWRHVGLAIRRPLLIAGSVGVLSVALQTALQPGLFLLLAVTVLYASAAVVFGLLPVGLIFNASKHSFNGSPKGPRA
jgi:O-antigen/teichoic acid export membrane protein